MYKLTAILLLVFNQLHVFSAHFISSLSLLGEYIDYLKHSKSSFHVFKKSGNFGYSEDYHEQQQTLIKIHKYFRFEMLQIRRWDQFLEFCGDKMDFLLIKEQLEAFEKEMMGTTGFWEVFLNGNLEEFLDIPSTLKPILDLPFVFAEIGRMRGRWPFFFARLPLLYKQKLYDQSRVKSALVKNVIARLDLQDVLYFSRDQRQLFAIGREHLRGTNDDFGILATNFYTIFVREYMYYVNDHLKIDIPARHGISPVFKDIKKYFYPTFLYSHCLHISQLYEAYLGCIESANQHYLNFKITPIPENTFKMLKNWMPLMAALFPSLDMDPLGDHHQQSQIIRNNILKILGTSNWNRKISSSLSIGFLSKYLKLDNLTGHQFYSMYNPQNVKKFKVAFSRDASKFDRFDFDPNCQNLHECFRSITFDGQTLLLPIPIETENIREFVENQPSIISPLRVFLYVLEANSPYFLDQDQSEISIIRRIPVPGLMEIVDEYFKISDAFKKMKDFPLIEFASQIDPESPFYCALSNIFVELFKCKFSIDLSEQISKFYSFTMLIRSLDPLLFRWGCLCLADIDSIQFFSCLNDAKMIKEKLIVMENEKEIEYFESMMQIRDVIRKDNSKTAKENQFLLYLDHHFNYFK